MHISVRLKFWFFEHYWWLLCISLAATVFALFIARETIATAATAVGAILSLAYFLQKQKLEELRLFRELFKEFNARYDVMNDELARISTIEPEKLTDSDRDKVVDYLNLCGEEYLFFRRGYIEPSVWSAWHNGMKALLVSPAIRSVWEREQKTGSYYGLSI